MLPNKYKSKSESESKFDIIFRAWYKEVSPLKAMSQKLKHKDQKYIAAFEPI